MVYENKNYKKEEPKKAKTVNLEELKTVCLHIDPEVVEEAYQRLRFHHGDSPKHPLLPKLLNLKNAILALNQSLES